MIDRFLKPLIQIASGSLSIYFIAMYAYIKEVDYGLWALIMMMTFDRNQK